MFDLVIIGGGIIGAACAYELSHYDISIAVLEAENDISTATTKANSAIIHAGFDPEPHTKIAKLNVQGAALTKEICKKLDIPYNQIGSMVIAFNKTDLDTLQILYDQGVKNGVEHMQLLNKDETKKLEPNLSEDVIGSLFAPSAAIISPWEFALALMEIAVINGAKLHLNSKVTSIETIKDGYKINTPTKSLETKCVINAAGISAGDIHNMVSEETYKIKQSRGEYYLLDRCEGDKVNHVIFQCPTKEGKGVLVSPTVHGNLIVGPNSIDIEDEDTSNTVKGLKYVAESAKKSVPSIDFRQSIRNFSGVRAASTFDDFIIEAVPTCIGFVDLAGIKSPGLSAAPAIAKLGAEILSQQGLVLNKKINFIDTRSVVRFKELSTSEKIKLVKSNSSYGKVICRCETITEGEILDALKSPIPPSSIDGIKRRCHAGSGRCQGGFCGPKILDLLAKELDVSPLDILQDKSGTFILTGETKGGAQNV